MQKPYEQLLGQQDDSKQVLVERIQRFKSSLAVVKVKKPTWWTGQWKRLYTIVEKKGGRGAPGWYGESRRHSEAAILGKGGVVTPTERVRLEPGMRARYVPLRRRGFYSTGRYWLLPDGRKIGATPGPGAVSIDESRDLYLDLQTGELYLRG